MSRIHLPLHAFPLALALLFTQAHAASLDGGVQGLQAEVQSRLSALLGRAAAPLRIASPTFA